MGSKKQKLISRAELIFLLDRNLEELSSTDFLNLFRSYNAIGDLEKSFKTTLVAIRKFPQDSKILRWHRAATYAWLVEPALVTSEFLRCLDDGVGPSNFWRLVLADLYIGAAWEGDDEMLDELPSVPEWLPLAARQLDIAQVTALEFCEYWGVKCADEAQETYELIFDGLLRFEEFARLRRLR